jgi:histidine ammonia-lyase
MKHDVKNNCYYLSPGKLTIENIAHLLDNPIKIKLNKEIYNRINHSRKLVIKAIDSKKTVYGINTGFGMLANKCISQSDLHELQKRIVLSHATGTGKFLDIKTVQLIMLLKINSLSQGYSGISEETLNVLIDMYNNCIYPLIPSQGSVGASGDLAPLAHMSMILFGKGKVIYKQREMSALQALHINNIKPVILQEKEGLALLNGTQVSTAIALIALRKTQRNYSLAVISGSMSIDALKGSLTPFNELIAEIKKCEGQKKFTRVVRDTLEGSMIRSSHIKCNKVQDPYSLRCQPQVMGTILQTLLDHRNQLINEANSVSDNPLIFPETGEILSGGNFHAERTAISSDVISICSSEIGSLSERRISLLTDSNLSNLPPFLVKNPGINSGFMLAHVTAASLASENKTLSHPASVDSLPTSANQEDHVSMATFAANKCNDIADNVLGILSIEILAACQGIDFHRPLKSSVIIEEKINYLREYIPFYNEDRYFFKDIELSKTYICKKSFYENIQSKCFE